MNRRGFFSKLAILAGAASCSPQIFLPKFEPVRWKVIRPERYLEIVTSLDGRFDPREFMGQWKWVTFPDAYLDYALKTIREHPKTVVIVDSLGCRTYQAPAGRYG